MADEKLLISIEAQTKAARAEIAKLSGVVKRGNKSMQSGFRRTTSAMKQTQRAAATLRTQMRGLLPVLSGAALAALSRNALASADTLVKTADKVGLTTDRLQELQFHASQAGVNQRTLNMAMQRFSRRMGEAAIGTGEALKTVKQYGVQVRNTDGTMKSNSEILGQWADKMRGAASDQERLRIAFKLFDSEGAALVNMMRDGAAGLDTYSQKARNLGLVIDEHLLRQAARTRDEFDILGRVIDSQFKRAILDIAPELQTAAKGMTAFFTDTVRSIKDAIRGTQKEIRTIEATFEAVSTGVSQAWTALGETLSSGAQAASKDISAAFLNMASFVLKGVQAAVNGIIALINEALTALRKFGTQATSGGAVTKFLSIFNPTAARALASWSTSLQQMQPVKAQNYLGKVSTGYETVKKQANAAAAAADKFRTKFEAARSRGRNAFSAGQQVYTDRIQAAQAQDMRGSFGLPASGAGSAARVVTSGRAPATGGKGGKGRSGGRGGREDRLTAALQRQIQSLRQQRAEMGMSQVASEQFQVVQRAAATILQQGNNLTDQQRQKLASVKSMQELMQLVKTEDIGLTNQQRVAVQAYLQTLDQEAKKLELVKRQTEQAREAKEQLRSTVERIAGGLEDSLINALEGGKNAMENFKNAVREMVKDVLKQILRLAIINPLLNSLGLGGGKNGTGLPSFFKIGKFASGGRPPVGVPSLVGERGPEMFVPDRAGTIVPNHKLGGGRSGDTYMIDARGADRAEFERFKAWAVRRDGMVEERAVAGVARERSRGDGPLSAAFA